MYVMLEILASMVRDSKRLSVKMESSGTILKDMLSLM
jgi:hypothetical protein